MAENRTKTENPGFRDDGEYWYINPGQAASSKRTVMMETDGSIADGNENAAVPNQNAGHRARLRERFREEKSFEGFSEHEVLELLMTYASPRKDMKKPAKDLLNSFGNLKGVFEARPEQLMTVEGVGEMQATFLSMMLPMTRVCLRCEMQDPRMIPNRRELEYFCKSLQVGKRVEGFWVICVNARCRVLGYRMISEGSLSEVSAYPRLVMETALNYNAHSVFFCHNHPGGTCAPSAEDIASTLQLQRLLNGVDIAVLDHMIIAGADAYSMAQHGDIQFGARGRSL